MAPRTTPRVPPVRPSPVPPPERLERLWLRGSALHTHSSNALNLLFPAGERFFIRSVKHWLPRIQQDPELLARVRGFFGQEAQHGAAHEALERVLEAQGLEIRSFLAWYHRLAFELIEPNVPPILCLSVTVALEHLTATLAEEALTTDVLDELPAELRDLLRWHAAEEIEHKAVAFDVLRAVDDGYALRIGGMVLAAALLVLFWGAGTRHLLKQEPELSLAQLRRELREGKEREHTGAFVVRGFLSYLSPRFHPDGVPNEHLAVTWLAERGLLPT